MTKTTTQATTPMWAAYDDMAVWGTGPTAEAAIADATQWVNPEDAARTRKGCRTAVMSAALQGQVERGGSASGHALLFDGTLGTVWERADEVAEVAEIGGAE
mgnify:CR=1 FL=1